MELLKIKNLSKYFDDKNPAVNDISFTLNQGEILAILGESGSGKTTLLHLIAALKEPDSGELLIENKAITPPSEKLIAGHPDIKLVKQDYGLFPNISIRENIAYELRFYESNYRNKRVNKLIKISNLAHVQDHLPRQVSGGEQQRAVIAKAIAEQPKLLLLDEPFSHLDSRNKRKLKEEILQIIRQDEVSCIFVTHDVNDAYGMADRLAIMRKGKFIQINTPQKIYQNPHNQYIAEITGEVNLIKPNEELYSHLVQEEASNLILIRPEKIKITSDSESLKVIINNVRFMGSYFEITANCLGSKLKFFHDSELNIGESINLQITNFQLIKK